MQRVTRIGQIARFTTTGLLVKFFVLGKAINLFPSGRCGCHVNGSDEPASAAAFRYYSHHAANF